MTGTLKDLGQYFTSSRAHATAYDENGVQQKHSCLDEVTGYFGHDNCQGHIHMEVWVLANSRADQLFNAGLYDLINLHSDVAYSSKKIQKKYVKTSWS